MAAVSWEPTLWITLCIGICVSFLALSFVERILRPAKAPAPEPVKNKNKNTAEFRQQADPSNRRMTERRSGNAIKILLTDQAMKSTYEQGWVVDRSLGGLRLAVRNEESPGVILSVRVAEQGSMPWIEVRVIHCMPSKNGYEIGCEFIRPTHSNWHMMFG